MRSHYSPVTCRRWNILHLYSENADSAPCLCFCLFFYYLWPKRKNHPGIFNQLYSLVSVPLESVYLQLLVRGHGCSRRIVGGCGWPDGRAQHHPWVQPPGLHADWPSVSFQCSGGEIRRKSAEGKESTEGKQAVTWPCLSFADIWESNQHTKISVPLSLTLCLSISKSLTSRMKKLMKLLLDMNVSSALVINMKNQNDLIKTKLDGFGQTTWSRR